MMPKPAVRRCRHSLLGSGQQVEHEGRCGHHWRFFGLLSSPEVLGRLLSFVSYKTRQETGVAVVDMMHENIGCNDWDSHCVLLL